MAESLGTLELLSRELGRVFAPLATRLSAVDVLNLFAELGLRFPPALTADPAFTSALTAAANAAGALPPLVDQLVAAADANDVAAIVDKSSQILQQVTQLITSIDTIAARLNAAGPLPGMIAAEVTAFANQLPTRLVDYLLVRYFETNFPLVFANLQLLGIAERTPMPGGADAAHPPFYQRRLTLSRISALLQSPDSLLRTLYGWGDPGFDGTLLLERIHQILFNAALPAVLTPAAGATPAMLSFFVFTLQARLNPPPRALVLRSDFGLPAAFGFELPVFSPNWKLLGRVRATLAAATSVTIVPPLEVTIAPPAGTVEGDLSLKVRGSSPNPEQPFRILGKQQGTRVEVKAIEAGALGAFRWNAAANRAEGDFGVEAKVEQGKIVIDLAGADGFLTSILPAGGFAFDFDLGIGYTGKRGLYFTGSAGIETAIGLHTAIGPVMLETLYLAVRAGATVELEISVAASAAIGPVAASVDRVGALVQLKFERGNLGPVDLDFAFKPPSGLGLVVDAGPITGGGYIYLDPAAGRYAGVLQLELFGISVTAIGILDTKLPGGQSGYSFLIIIAAEFPPIQLSFGFTLNGVGGLAGIHRTIATEALQAGVRSGGIDHILFPQNPVQNATRIISDLSAFFPPLQNHFVFGPMAMIGWGTPKLITLELGIIIELPNPVRIVLLGQLSAALPTAEAAIVELHVDVLGILDFGAKFFSLDGSLHDSRVALFSLSGDFALRLNWGDDPSFALSLGGLHPHFQPPPNFPALRRLTIALGSGDNPRISSQIYMALTSNSVQFGARAELYAAAAGFNVYGWFGYDVLVIFSPFSFRADFSAGVALRRGTSTIAGVRLDATLTGPTPWHAWGEASLSLFFFDISVGFDVTIGESRRVELPPADVWGPLQAALQDARNWSAALPPAAARVVSLLEPPGTTTVIVDPMGTVTVREIVAPLNRTLTKFGEAKPQGANRFDLSSVKVGSQPVTGFSTVKEQFAPGHFETLSDDQKLSRPSFERMDGGVALSANAVTTGTVAGTDVAYETIIIDSPWDSHDAPLFFLPRAHLEAMMEVSAASLAGTRSTGLEKYVKPGAPAKVLLAEEEFVIASADDLKARPELAAASTKGALFAALDAHYAVHPEDRGRLLVVPRHEVEAA
jgi:hypothetical protein